MKAVQITVIKGTEVLGTVLRATTASDQELIMALMQDEKEPLHAEIKVGNTINVGTEWYFFDAAEGIKKITDTADWNTNTAWFYDVNVFNQAIAQGMEFRGFNKETKLQSYVQTAATESQDPLTGEAGAKNVEDMKAQTKEKSKKRLFGSKHGKSKEKVSKEADDDIDFCGRGILVLLNMFRSCKQTAALADAYQDLLYKPGTTDAKSLRELADKISHNVHETITFHEKFVKGKTVSEIVTLKAMIIDGETKTIEIEDEDGNIVKVEVPRTIFDKILDLLLWTYDQLEAFCKQWSKGTVFLPFRVIMAALKGILDVVRLVAGAGFYIVNGIVCLVDAASMKLLTFALGVVSYFKERIANWKSIKDEPAVEATTV